MNAQEAITKLLRYLTNWCNVESPQSVRHVHTDESGTIHTIIVDDGPCQGKWEVREYDPEDANGITKLPSGM